MDRILSYQMVWSGSVICWMCLVSSDWPQVHTVTRYIANEHDELDLEEADVVSVNQSSSDG